MFSLAMGYFRLGRMVIGGTSPKLDFTPRDVENVADVAFAMATKDLLIKQGMIPQ